MNKSLIIFFAFLPYLFAELPYGNFNSVYVSEISGDQGGYEIEIKPGGKKGFFAEYMGERQPENPLKKISCKDKENLCEFSFKRPGEKEKGGSIILISKNQAILTIKEDNLKKILYKDGKIPEWISPDNFSYAEGKVYEKPTLDSKVLVTLPSMSKVKFLQYMLDDPQMMAEIEVNGSKGYVEYNQVGSTERALINGEKVRFRKEPNTNSEILLEFKKYTEIAILGDDRSTDWKYPNWTKIIYQGKIGYVSSDFVVY
jgi:hypothetical protein